MGKGRVEAFTDGVIAIIITIMVLELKVPHAPSMDAVISQWPVFLSYILSFVYVGIYWNNHHHMLHVVKHVDGRVLWANLHLLFWLSLIPFVTSWMSEEHFAALPVALYGAVLLMAALAWPVMIKTLIAVNGKDSLLAKAIGGDVKGKLSIVTYVLAIAIAFVLPWLACVLYAGVAIMWFVPDRRIESRVIAK